MSSTNFKHHPSGSFSQKSLSSSSLGDGQTLYCLCRSSDCSTFMIACDACNIWYHGICIGMSEKESAKIENFFCHQCRHKKPSLQIKYTKPQKEIEEKLSKWIRKRLRKEAELLNPSLKQIDTSVNDRKNREHSSSIDQFANDDSTSNQSDSSSSSAANVMSRQKQVLHGNTSNIVRSTGIQPVQYETLTSRDDQEQINKHPLNTTKRALITKNATASGKRKRNMSSSGIPTIKREPRSELNDEEDTKKLSVRRRRRTTENSARQCYGPSCLFEARPESKYCSDKCGLELARNRLLQFLPMRLMQWQTIPSVADTLNKTAIDEIIIEIDQIKQRLSTLDERQRKLDEIIERGKQIKAIKDTDKYDTINDEHDGMCFCILCNQEISQKAYIRHIDKCFIRRLSTLDERQRKLDEIIERGKQIKAIKDTDKYDTINDEHDGMCFCILCNQEISQKAYIRHIDKCFIRFESQVSYGSNVKSNIEGLFCDNYDRTNNLYCKRLKVICPEHSREPKIAPDEACGCPLEKNLFEVSDELCTAPKRLCSKHFKWDRRRRAQIDLERLHELMRFEELIEKENRLRIALSERGSVAGLLLHKTIAH
ncbi:unnamed protein product [Adineta steineri]|uniref:CXXC-type zinc finger protein 1 n=1 Tax=Adineta steineri TaxID=433720 RepID=A0A814SCL4_9BILA|nr:unnamed protein product [Adineta steineri]